MSATPPSGPSPAPAYATDSEELFDYSLVGHWVRFASGSVRRNRRRAAAVSLGFFFLALTAPWVMPKKWRTETKILIQRNQMDQVANPGAGPPNSEDAPTRAASELVMRRDNLITLIKQTNLLEHYEQGRPGPLRALDRLRRLFSGPMTEEDKFEALISILEKRLTVTTGDGTVTLSLTWSDPQLSYRLVDTLQQNFIESRHTIEVSSIAEVISILEGHSAELRDSITATIEELRKATDPSMSQVPAAGGVLPRPVATPRPGPDPEAVAIESRIAVAAKAINDLEESRNRRLMELQGQLAEQVAIYGPSHPEIINRKLSIEALQRDSPQIEALRREEKSLRERLAAVVARRQTPEKALPPAPAPINLGESRSVGRPSREDDVGIAYLRNQQRIMSEKLEEMQGRIKEARIKLDVARAGFKNRYVIVQPARVPKKPSSPPPALIVAAGAVAGLLFGLVAAVVADVRAGRILEAWQIEKVLKLPLLGEVRLP